MPRASVRFILLQWTHEAAATRRSWELQGALLMSPLWYVLRYYYVKVAQDFRRGRVLDRWLSHAARGDLPCLANLTNTFLTDPMNNKKR